MSCKCRDTKVTDYSITPDKHCLLCAEKHFSTALCLAEEVGYVAPNRQRIIGELVCASWHIYKEEYSLAERLRDLRHLVQERKEKEITTQWADIASAIDLLITKDGEEL